MRAAHLVLAFALLAGLAGRGKGPQGDAGPAGPAGPKGDAGPAGSSGVRVVRSDCASGSCTVECQENEVLVTANCGPKRSPALFTKERSASCGPPDTPLIAVCIAGSQANCIILPGRGLTERERKLRRPASRLMPPQPDPLRRQQRNGEGSSSTTRYQ